MIKFAILFKDETGFHLIGQNSGQGSQLDEQSLEELELETTELGVRRNQLHSLNKTHRPKATRTQKLSLLSSCVSSNLYDLPRQTQNPNTLVEDRAQYRQTQNKSKVSFVSETGVPFDTTRYTDGDSSGHQSFIPSYIDDDY